MPSTSQNKKCLVVICGPTAAGKTALAIEVANHFRTEIISADSRQFYKEMNIGTAKPNPDELAAVQHHFIDILSIHDSYTAGVYERDTLTALDKIFASQDIAVMVGGSGLFIKAICDGFDNFADDDNEVTEDIKIRIRAMSLSEMQMEVSKLDPEYFAKVDRHNPRRLQRALQVIYTTGRPYSMNRTGKKTERPFDIIKIGLRIPREHLYQRINSRVDTMIKNGLVEEVADLYPFKHLQPLHTVGYQELFDYMEGRYSLPVAIEKIKQNTRHYAKRQMTWFNKDSEVIWRWGEMSYQIIGKTFTYSHQQVKESIIQFLDWGSTRTDDGRLNLYTPLRNPSQSWEQTEAIYIRLIQKKWPVKGILDLVKYIRSSGLSERLYGYTSHENLLIGASNYLTPDHQILQIDLDEYFRKKDLGEKLHLKYYDQKGVIAWETSCTGEYLVKAFDEFIMQNKW